MNVLEAIEKMREGKLYYYLDEDKDKILWSITKLPITHAFLQEILNRRSVSGEEWYANMNMPLEGICAEWYEYEE